MSRKSNFVKDHKYVFIIIMALVGIVVCLGVYYIIVGVVSASGDRTYKDAIKIAKKDYNCDEILWTDGVGSVKSKGLGGIATMGGHLIIAKSNNEQIFLLIPTAKYENPQLLQWQFDYTYSEIIEHVNAAAADMAFPENYKKTLNSDDMYLECGIDRLRSMGIVNEDNSDKLDVPIAFEFYFRKLNNGTGIQSIVTQENHKLMLYNTYTGDEGMEI